MVTGKAASVAYGRLMAWRLARVNNGKVAPARSARRFTPDEQPFLKLDHVAPPLVLAKPNIRAHLPAAKQHQVVR